MTRVYTLILCLSSFGVNAQHLGGNYISFDPLDTFGQNYHQYIIFDSTHNHNTWQVGAPHKTVFSSAFSLPNALVTDTIGNYPANDTSIFILRLPTYLVSGGPGAFSVMMFYYELDIDSGDIARVEISEDSGNHWINLLDSLPGNLFWSPSGAPVLNESTVSWNQFRLTANWIFPDSTLYFRFTFISDNADSTKDGWMIDNIELDYYWEGVPQIQNDNLITLYPNPSKGNIYIHSTKQTSEEPTIIIYNTNGQEVYKTDKLPPTGYLNLPLPDGIYSLKYATKDEYCVKRIIITR